MLAENGRNSPSITGDFEESDVGTKKSGKHALVQQQEKEEDDDLLSLHQGAINKKLQKQLIVLQERLEALEQENQRLRTPNVLGQSFRLDGLNGITSSHHHPHNNSSHHSSAAELVQILPAMNNNASVQSMPANFGTTREDQAPTPPPSRDRIQKWKKLEESFHTIFDVDHDIPTEDEVKMELIREKRALVFLHPEEVGERDYTKEELRRVQLRPFPSRFYITNIPLEVRKMVK
jgi:hypothetical protein